MSQKETRMEKCSRGRGILPRCDQHEAGCLVHASNRFALAGAEAARWGQRALPLALIALAIFATPLLAQRTTQSLAGEWRFALDRADAGLSERWFARDLAGRDRIALPGILQAQGYGDEIRPDTPWVLSLGDAWWKLQPAALREKFSQPGHVEVPFLAQPPRHYLGAAWYQHDIEVPEANAPRRFVLLLERPHWESRVWLDEKAFAPDHGLCTPHSVDLGQLAPGRHRLTIRIDNRQIIRDPQNDGHQADAHSISDALGAAWNGIVGRLELQSTPLVWLEDVQVFPDVAKKSARVKITLGNANGQPGRGKRFVLSAGDTAAIGAANEASAPIEWSAAGGGAELTIALGAGAQTWDEFHPALQRLKVLLDAGGGRQDARDVTFGLREVGWHDKDLLVNGAVVNLRTTHFGGDFPLTGFPAMDTASWRKIFRVCQDFGLNGMRFHSWCPPEAAFAAADELGFYLAPECGLWAPFTAEGPYTKLLEEETPRILAAYGNHPSFVLLSPSNEPGGNYPQITPAWAKAAHEKDPRRLYAAATGWSVAEQVNGGAQFAALVRFNGGELRNITGWFGRDYRSALTTVHVPVLSHEVGQWCAYPDFDVMKAFTSYLRPGNYDIFRFIAEQNGVLEFDHDFAWASGRFQLACYKEEIEANLRTPGLAGYQLLDLHDYLGQGTALIGVCDAFWQPKSYVTAAEFRRFNGATVPLARLEKRIFTTAETLTSDVELYHFGEKPLVGARPYWKIIEVASGRTAVEGNWDPRDVPIGKNIPLGNVSAELATLAAPAACKLVVGVRAASDAPIAENDWNFWLYPARIEADVPADVLVTSNWTDAEARLAAGGKVLFTPAADGLDVTRCPPMKRVPVFWNIQMTVRPPRNPAPRFDAMLGLLCDARHPALASFPTDRNCDWQWTPLVENVRSINLTAAPRALRPIVAAIDDWNRNWRLGVIFECNVGPGRLLVSAIDLNKPEASAGEQQLRRSLLDYMDGEKFRPAASLAPEQVRALWRAPGSVPMPAPGKRAFDPDLNDGSLPQPAGKNK